METTSAWPTWMAPTIHCCSPIRKAQWVSDPSYVLFLPKAKRRAVAEDVLHIYLFIVFTRLLVAGLSIDFDTEQLYWISSRNSTINHCKMDGSEFEVIESVKGKFTKATALAIMGERTSSSYSHQC